MESSSTSISVLLCTHNPRTDYLDRVLTALRDQTLANGRWELLIIDNGNEPPLANRIDVSWHPRSRCVIESECGLTPARLKGIREARGELLVFVDDDNVLDNNYLEVALQIAVEYPWVGAWGGQIRPEFESPPPEETRPFWGYLAIREFETDSWSNQARAWESVPCGAGMIVRATVAQRYAQKASENPLRRRLDRIGNRLVSCGDTDIALTAHEIGLGTGQFAALRMTHLLPQQRLTRDYLLRLAEGGGYSEVLLNSSRGKPIPPQMNWIRLWKRAVRRALDKRLQTQWYVHWEKGQQQALRELARARIKS